MTDDKKPADSLAEQPGQSGAPEGTAAGLATAKGQRAAEKQQEAATTPARPTAARQGPPDEEALAAAEAALQAFEQGHRAVKARPADKGEVAQRPPVVRFERVTKTYSLGTPKAFTAIKEVSFEVADLPGKGEFICLLGPSGCGKSTVLRLIAGLEPQHPATSGRVEVFGKPVEGPGADRGMVFQSYTSFDHRTVLDNVAFGLECRGMPNKERVALAQDWIAKVGLSVKNDANKYPHQLSGGMQQRVAIARSLILKPRIILMDEPFGALDPITRAQMQDLAVALWREVEATVFFVTHSIEEAVYLADRAYLFSNSPGTILRELEVPPPDLPSLEMQRDPAFQQVVFELRDIIQRLEHEQVQARAQRLAAGKGG